MIVNVKQCNACFCCFRSGRPCVFSLRHHEPFRPSHVQFAVVQPASKQFRKVAPGSASSHSLRRTFLDGIKTLIVFAVFIPVTRDAVQRGVFLQMFAKTTISAGEMVSEDEPCRCITTKVFFLRLEEGSKILFTNERFRVAA